VQLHKACHQKFITGRRRLLLSRNPLACRLMSESRHNAFWTWKGTLTAITHHWGLEAQAVLICFSMCNPNNIGIVHSLNMKDGLFQEPPPEHGPADLLVRCAYDSHESRRSTHKHYWQKIVCLVLVVAVTDRDDLMSANTTSKGNLDSTHCYCMSPGHHLLPPDNAVMPNSVTV